MTSPPTAHDRQSPPAGDATESQSTDRSGSGAPSPEIAAQVRRAGFWTAIVLPFLHIPLLATGLTTAGETAIFFGLVAANLLALYAGRSHRR